MIAKIKRLEDGYLAHYARHLKQEVEHVWTMLTDNKELEKWFQELRMGESGKGGFMNFDMQDGNFEKLEIFEYVENSVLAFDWFGNTVRFEMNPEKNGCSLIFSEHFSTINDQTSKDLAGWHVCLDVIKSLLDDNPTHFREDEWKKWHTKYVQAVESLK